MQKFQHFFPYCPRNKTLLYFNILIPSRKLTSHPWRYWTMAVNFSRITANYHSVAPLRTFHLSSVSIWWHVDEDFPLAFFLRTTDFYDGKLASLLLNSSNDLKQNWYNLWDVVAFPHSFIVIIHVVKVLGKTFAIPGKVHALANSLGMESVGVLAADSTQTSQL